MEELPRLDDGLTPLERRILTTLAKHSNLPRRKTIASHRLLELVVGAPTPSLEEKLTAARRDARDPHLQAYLALVELAQPFRTRYPLVTGVGNFGTIDGDPPADARFTRCAASPFGVAAARGTAPTLLVNGAATGGGVFLPHRLGDVLDATATLIAHPTIGDDELAASVPGPDFPTGGVVAAPASMRSIYRTGRGEVRLRARAEIAGGSIVVTELPFGIAKSDVVRDAHEALRTGALPGIESVSDESDARGIRIELGVRARASAERALAALFARTRLETTLEVDMTAIVDDAPARVSLPALVRAYARQLAAALTRGTRAPDRKRLLAELDALRAAHDDARRTDLAAPRASRRR